ncbi:hypothetical protein N182_28110 [Sinorhizobium sp. GL2]|nr:hypothetical protein N182_28110 [Sinorhizobium sp. GL2]
MSKSLKLDYVEFYTPDLEVEREFFAKAFGWDFVKLRADFLDIRGSGIGSGIERAAETAPLIVVKTDDLDEALAQIRKTDAKITRDIWAWTGGRRFEFTTPGGTRMAVWSPSAD